MNHQCPWQTLLQVQQYFAARLHTLAPRMISCLDSVNLDAHANLLSLLHVSMFLTLQ